MSTIRDVDISLGEVREVEMQADLDNDGGTVDACQVVLDKLLERRLHMPLQRPPSDPPLPHT